MKKLFAALVKKGSVSQKADASCCIVEIKEVEETEAEAKTDCCEKRA